MNKRMLIDAASIDETRVVVLDDDHIDVVDFENSEQKQLKSNVYLARITRVEPSLQAAFVDYGGNRHGFLPFSEIHPDYYQIPAEDREQLINEAAQLLAERQEARTKARAENRAYKSDGLEHPELGISVNDASLDNNGSIMAAVEISDDNQLPFISELIPTTNPMSAGSAIEESVDDLDTERDKDIATNDLDNSDNSAEDQADLAALDDIEAASIEKNNADSDTEDPETHSNDDDFLDDDNELEARSILRSIIAGRYKIQDVIKRRQVIVIQVNKEERGNKGAALTSYLSLAGRYCVLMPNTQRGGGISRKISNPKDRRKIKQILGEIVFPSGVSVIVRTAGAERSKAEIRRDYEYLMRTWDEIREKVLNSQAPTLVHEEGSVIKRAVRDLYSRDMDEIIVDGQDGYNAAKNFMRTLTPSHAKKVRFHKNPTPLFLEAGIEAQLDSLHDPVVTLASGGYLVMNQTEALVAVDVNSGKATKEKNIEDTALLTNLEAATEVARQLRLRDMAGLIVIDFIDMLENRHRMQVERKLRDAMRSDRARIQLGRISDFGLLELSRQRLRPSVFETSMQTCATCSGTGLVRTDSSFGRAILRRVEQLAKDNQKDLEAIEITVPFSVGLVILNQLRSELLAMEGRLECSVSVIPDAHTEAPSFQIILTVAGREQLFEEGKRKGETTARHENRSRNERNKQRSADDKDHKNSRRNKSRIGQSQSQETDPPTNAAAEKEDKRASKRNSNGGRKQRKGKDTPEKDTPEKDTPESENTIQPAQSTVDNADTQADGHTDLSHETENQNATDATTSDAEEKENQQSVIKGRRRGNRGGRRRVKKDETENQTAENATQNGTTEPVSVSSDSVTPPKASEPDTPIVSPSTHLQEDTAPKDIPKKRGWFSRARDALNNR